MESVGPLNTAPSSHRTVDITQKVHLESQEEGRHVGDAFVGTIWEKEGVKWREMIVVKMHDILEVKGHCETHYYIQWVCTKKKKDGVF